MEEIVNKVADSGLITLDLADFKPTAEVVELDFSDQLWQGLVLKEKDFRAWIKSNDWEKYRGKAVSIVCTADAIIPTWAYMLIGSQLTGIATDFIAGPVEDLHKKMILKSIYQLDTTPFTDGKIIIKGCSDIPFPEFAMTELLAVLQPLSKSIMYGEPCSTVPLYKRKS